MEAEHEPTVVVRSERVLDLVAVAPLLDRGLDRLDRRVLEAADAREGVPHLGLLLAQLCLVPQHLPRRARMRRARLDPVGAGLQHLERPRLAVVALGLGDERTHAVAGHRALHEQDVAVGPGHPRTAVRERVDSQLELRAAVGASAFRGCLRGLGHAGYAGTPWI